MNALCTASEICKYKEDDHSQSYTKKTLKHETDSTSIVEKAQCVTDAHCDGFFMPSSRDGNVVCPPKLKVMAAKAPGNCVTSISVWLTPSINDHA